MPHEYLSNAVTLTQYEKIVDDPSLMHEGQDCPILLEIAQEWQGCSGTIVLNDTHTNSTHAAPQSSQKARNNKKKNKKK